MRLRISIGLKAGVLDPQGKATQQALENLGFEQIEALRIGKEIILDLKTNDQKLALSQAEEMCKKILVNQVVEDFSIEIIPAT